MGWKHSTKNLPASYLTGLLLAKKAQEKGVKDAILDLGLQTPLKGSRLYAALKGVIDGGLDVPASEEVFPNEDRLKGSHVADEKVQESFTKLKATIEKQ
jgi:large subunit ribosomal protein L18